MPRGTGVTPVRVGVAVVKTKAVGVPRPPGSFSLVKPAWPRSFGAMTTVDAPATSFLELGEQTLVLARARTGPGLRTVDELCEVWLGEPDAALATIREFVPAGAAGPVVLLRPRSRSTLRATADQGAKIADEDGLRQFIRHRFDAAGQQAGWAWCAPEAGGPPAPGRPWLLDVLLAPACAETFEQLALWGIAPLRCQSARLTQAGALVGALGSEPAAAPLLFCDIGETRTDLLVITPRGVESIATVAAGLGLVVDALQAALQLRLRGTALRLIFGGEYDFTELGAKIFQPLADRLKPALAGMRQRPVSLVCSGLCDGQPWGTAAFADDLGLRPFSLNLAGWAAAKSLGFASGLQVDTIPPAWLGLLSAVAAFKPDEPEAVLAWQPCFIDTPVPAL